MFRQCLKQILPVRLTHAIQQHLLRRSIASYSDRVVRHRYGGHEFAVHLTDNLAHGWYDHDWEEPQEITLLKQWSLKPGAVVFDLGAHQGVVAMMLAAACSPGGRVVCVEGSLHNAQVARKNMAANGIESVRVEHAVVGETHGGELLFSSTLNGSVRNDGAGERVRRVSIDGLISEQGMPDLVFLDVEGYECQALRGGRLGLEGRADFFVEVHQGAGLEANGSVQELMAFFPEERFELHLAAGEGMPFVRWKSGDRLPAERFFLAARRRPE